jgi:poly-gamma-glutamate capsule biosynthesis protein CapA/YwtB (metallophosphatase superfamily)
VIRVVVVGDVSDWNIPSFDIRRVPENLRDIIRGADLFVPNLEGPVAVKDGYPDFQLFRNPLGNRLARTALRVVKKLQPRVFSTPAILDLLSLGERSTCVVLANNHTKDLGEKGVVDTVALLRREKLSFVGAGANRREANLPCQLTVAGKQFVVLNYNYVGLRKADFFLNIYGATRRGFGAAYLPLPRVREEIARLRAETQDAFVLLVAHAGRAMAPSRESSGIPHADFETLGADCVVFHHTHYFLGAFSERSFCLGDFVFRHVGERGLPEDRPGGFLELRVDPATNRFETRTHTYRFRGGYPWTG